MIPPDTTSPRWALLASFAFFACAGDKPAPSKDAAVQHADANARRDGQSVDATLVDAHVPVDAGAAPWKPPARAFSTAPCPSERRPSTHEEDAGASSSDDGLPGANPIALSMLPQLGEVTSISARVWLRSETAADVCFEYWPRLAPEQRTYVLGPRLAAEHDFTGVVAPGALQPATHYEYRVLLAEPDGTFTMNAARSSFRTAAPVGKPGKVRIIFGGDIAGGRGSRNDVFTRMQAHEPDLVLLIGDLFYAGASDLTLDDFRQRSRGTWSKPQLAALAARVPTLGMWDDHDIFDNYYAGKTPLYVPARRAFDEYTAARNPPPVRSRKLYFTTTLGEVDVFVLDVRSDRSPNEDVDGPDKTILGSEQLDDLRSWLLGSSGKIKIIASPVLFADHSTTGNDSWTAYANEREAIFDFIVEHEIDDVLLLSGDQHWSAIFSHLRGDPAYTFYEFQATPLSKSPRSAPSLRGDDVLASFGGDTAYGVVDVDTREGSASVTMTLCRGTQPCTPGEEPPPEAGKAPFSLRVPLDRIGLSND